eukprot:6334601-Pyramimonas_sp.AAC.1
MLSETSVGGATARARLLERTHPAVRAAARQSEGAERSFAVLGCVAEAGFCGADCCCIDALRRHVVVVVVLARDSPRPTRVPPRDHPAAHPATHLATHPRPTRAPPTLL